MSRTPNGSTNGSANGSAPLTVMSYNIHGQAALVSRRHLAGVSRVIEQARPDIVGLQEVHRGTWTARFRDQVDELAERTGMSAHFGRSLELRTGEFGNAILVRGEVLDSTVHSLPGEGERRSLLQSRIEVRGTTLEFYVTHLAAWGRLTRSIREQQARFIADHLSASEHPFILTGDLNAPPEAPELYCLLAPDHLQMCGDQDAGTHRFMRGRIDYIFAHPRFRTVDSRVLRSGPSDHFPVVARLEGPLPVPLDPRAGIATAAALVETPE